MNNVWGIAYDLYRQVESLQLSYDADVTSEDHLMVLPVNMTMLVARLTIVTNQFTFVNGFYKLMSLYHV